MLQTAKARHGSVSRSRRLRGAPERPLPPHEGFVVTLQGIAAVRRPGEGAVPARVPLAGRAGGTGRAAGQRAAVLHWAAL